MKAATIIVNNLDDGRYLPGLLESIRVQDCDNFDVLGLDAGSSDDSLEVYAAHGVEVVDVTGLNQAASVNRAAGLILTPYFAWINPDDRYLPNFVSSHLAAFEALPESTSVVHSNLLIRNAAGKESLHVPRGIEASLEDGQNYVFHPTTMIRRWSWGSVGGFDDSLAYAFDFEFWVRVHLAAHPVRHIPDTTAVFCPRPDSLTGTRTDAIRAEIRRVQERHGLPTDRRYRP